MGKTRLVVPGRKTVCCVLLNISGDVGHATGAAAGDMLELMDGDALDSLAVRGGRELAQKLGKGGGVAENGIGDLCN